MRVIATAGHVDHGKSTLIRALTGTDPDRLAEEKRRGLSIELGFAWTTIEGAGEVAFVDVPGHQKFVSTTLAGLGPAPAVLFVVAADEGWRRQSTEHLAALDALGVEHGLLVITRSDLAEPARAAAQAVAACGATSLRDAPWVAVSAATGAGMTDLRRAIGELARRLSEPETPRRQRIWIDRAFSVTGTGTVVTGTLAAGTLTVGDALELNGERVTVKALETLGRSCERVSGTARVAVALRGLDRRAISRGDALLEPRRWQPTSLIEARTAVAEELTRQLLLHVGTAAVPVTVRRLSETHLRVTLSAPLPLEIGDRAVLRDPGLQRVAAGITVVDTDPPRLGRRGDAARHARALAGRGGALDPLVEVGRRPFVTSSQLDALGLTIDPANLPAGVTALDGHLLTGDHLAELIAALVAAVGAEVAGAPLETLRARLGLPTQAALRQLIAAAPGLTLTSAGRVANPSTSMIPGDLAQAADQLAKRWAADPLDAPAAEELLELGLDQRGLGILRSLGVALKLSDTVVVSPRGPGEAVEVLRRLEQPFTASEAREALGSTRRITLPLLGYLDAKRLTLRGADDRRRLR